MESVQLVFDYFCERTPRYCDCPACRISVPSLASTSFMPCPLLSTYPHADHTWSWPIEAVRKPEDRFNSITQQPAVPGEGRQARALILKE